MSATTIGIPHAHTAPGLDRLTTLLLLAFVATVQVSIVAAQILLGALLLCWVVATGARQDSSRRRRRSSSRCSPTPGSRSSRRPSRSHPLESFIDRSPALLFLIVPVVYDLARGQRTTTVMDVIITVGARAAAYGIVQYGMLHFDSLGQRPRGTLGHYMTYSGTLMLVIGVAAARLVFGVARSRLAGARHAGARRRAVAHVHAQRVGRRLRRRRPAVHPEGLPAHSGCSRSWSRCFLRLRPTA